MRMFVFDSIIVQASLRYKGQETVIIFLPKTIRAEN